MLRLMIVAAFAALCSSACAQPGQPAGQIVIGQPTSQPSGLKVHLPLKRAASRKSGLELYVDSRWVNSYGYRPYEVTIVSKNPSTADQLITIQLHSGSSGEMSVEQDFELAAGSTLATTIVAVPTYGSTAHSFWFDVSVDGEKDVDLSVDKTSPFIGGTASGSGSILSILVAGTANNHKSLYSNSNNDFQILSLNLGDFPRSWIDYSSLDVVSLSTSELQLLGQQHRAAFEAIGRWVRTGGHLWVSDVGENWQQLSQVSQLLHIPDALNLPSTDAITEGLADKLKAAVVGENQAHEVGWRAAQFRLSNFDGWRMRFRDPRSGAQRILRNPDALAALQRDSTSIAPSQQNLTVESSFERRWLQDSSQWFVEQRLGLGLVRAFRGANEAAMFTQTAPNVSSNSAFGDDSTDQDARAFAAGVRSTRHWENRHGITPDASAPEFASLLVEGVGLAPVLEFQVLITLFVLLIGPVNYWLLRRYKRLHLLVLTVPVAAVATTVSLFAYAIVSDGFGTTVRVRSVTTLDQRSGEAACWSRLSYYSGLAPAKGLTLPVDVAIYPILPNWSPESSRTQRELVWGENDMKLTSGWLSSRTPTQYLTVRSRKSANRLDLLAAESKMRVTNLLGTQVNSLIVLDDAGKFYAGEQLVADSTTVLPTISREEAGKRIFQLLRDNPEQLPEWLVERDRDSSLIRNRSGRRGNVRVGPQHGNSQLSDNVASRALSDLAGLNGLPPLDLPPRSYVAVTATGPEVETGIPNAKEEGSFHVILGQW